MRDPNLDQLIAAAEALRPLLPELVFVGGCVTGLLITDQAAGEPRGTVDVDAIAEITSYAQYAEFGERLRSLGFREDPREGAPVCRWVQGGMILDVMPLDPNILGFSNRWYKGAMEASAPKRPTTGTGGALIGSFDATQCISSDPVRHEWSHCCLGVARSMALMAETRGIGNQWGLAVLVGYFLLICAMLLALAAAWRGYRAYVVKSRWLETAAQIRKCSLEEYHPFAREGGGVVYSLECRLAFAMGSRRYESDVRTISDRSLAMRGRISEWIADNPPGTTLILRVNPSAPQELVVESALPIRQFSTANDALVSSVLFGIPGILFIAVGRVLVRRRS